MTTKELKIYIQVVYVKLLYSLRMVTKTMHQAKELDFQGNFLQLVAKY